MTSGNVATAQQTLANTGADAGLLPLALALLAIGALLVIRRKKA
jgi:LPXTG-motif cell wall-anchored protein